MKILSHIDLLLSVFDHDMFRFFLSSKFLQILFTFLYVLYISLEWLVGL